ncbi:restriction endonuclease subunit S [Halolactibacillus alkaliphilus]|uniref:Restriction endonuclease subunit S n=1 Tax=Halolactibacillus alkaliphilus TaxID=442899 RepID=A0A511X4B1_9BACI|nr:restriction endonuclease subunit S [Halolactibacillus alkaliphilus]GEN57788.1 restriction endonuclease subunit S [Halolactibacillus alkaliphilus]GGN75062.1 restriction endonuclease subunit S [Halolactibacillus alkaliphilus]SFP04563.1 type I restriction enzyme, S subunit [Halolactibacillus alkaliphilus]
MKRLKLDEVCDILNGYAFKSSKYSNKGYRIIRITNVQKGIIVGESPKYYSDKDMVGLERYKLFENDILLSLTGNVGRVGIMNNSLLPAALNQRVACLRLKNDDVCYKYLFYYLNSDEFENLCIENANGIAQKNLSTSFLKTVSIPIPPLDIQKKIIEVLDKSQELVDKRKEQITALSNLKQSIFYDIFGDPQLNNKKWKLCKIGDLTKKTQYGSSKKASLTDGEFAMLRMNNITYKGDVVLDELKYVNLDEKEKEKHLVHKGELLFNRTNSKELVGKTAVYDHNEPIAYAGYLIKLIPNELANSYFISGYLNSNYGKRYLYNLAKNIVGMANINAKELRGIPIYMPPKKLQDEYGYKIKKINKSIDLFKQGQTELEMLYGSLMQKAFKGELFN